MKHLLDRILLVLILTNTDLAIPILRSSEVNAYRKLNHQTEDLHRSDGRKGRQKQVRGGGNNNVSKARILPKQKITTKSKLQVQSIEECIGFINVTGGTGIADKDWNLAVYMNCENAPEFEFTSDYQLKLADSDFCMHAIDHNEIQARPCKKNKKEQIYYAFAVTGEENTWRFYSKSENQFLGLGDGKRSSHEHDYPPTLIADIISNHIDNHSPATTVVNANDTLVDTVDGSDGDDNSTINQINPVPLGQRYGKHFSYQRRVGVNVSTEPTSIVITEVTTAAPTERAVQVVSFVDGDTDSGHQLFVNIEYGFVSAQ